MKSKRTICLEERCCLHNPLRRSFRRSRQERTPRLVHRKAREPNKGLTTAQVCGNHFFRLQKRRSSCYSRIVRPCPPLSWQQRRTNGSSLRQLSWAPAFSVTSWAVTHSSQRERAAIVDFLSALYPYALTQTLVQSSGTSGNSERGREAFGAFHPTTRMKHWGRPVTEPRRKQAASDAAGKRNTLYLRMKGTEMRSLKMSWSLCDGRLTAKWSEQTNEPPLTSPLRETPCSAKWPTSITGDGVRSRTSVLVRPCPAGTLFNKAL